MPPDAIGSPLSTPTPQDACVEVGETVEHRLHCVAAVARRGDRDHRYGRVDERQRTVQQIGARESQGAHVAGLHQFQGGLPRGGVRVAAGGEHDPLRAPERRGVCCEAFVRGEAEGACGGLGHSRRVAVGMPTRKQEVEGQQLGGVGLDGGDRALGARANVDRDLGGVRERRARSMVTASDKRATLAGDGQRIDQVGGTSGATVCAASCLDQYQN